MLMSELCTEYEIPHRITDWNEYGEVAPKESLLRASTELYRLSGEDTIVVGGHAVLPDFLGYRKMRKRSGDIDSVAREQGVRTLVSSGGSWEDLHYGIREEELFLSMSSVPVGVSLDKIHDWDVPRDFRGSSIVFEVPGMGQLRVASPEYQIMLKLRRGRHCMDCNRPFYGKDRVDITNMLLASLYHGGRKTVNLGRLTELVLEHVFSDPNCLSVLLSNASLYNVGSLRKQEKKDLVGVLDEFSHNLLGS